MRFRSIGGLLAVSVVLGIAEARADATYAFRVVASNLDHPTGIAVEGSETLYFTLVPTPGVPGANSVAKLDLETGQITTLHVGEPEPRNIVVGRDGTAYWTCTSAGVILTQTEDGVTDVLLSGLDGPVGIALDRRDRVYFTEVPTPGVAGGANRISVFDRTATSVLHMGDPEPVDVAVARNGDVFWTCKSAGVILKRSGGTVSLVRGGLDQPVGLALDHKDEKLYFTEVPTPGIPGSAGGRNRVSALDLASGELRLINAGDPEPTDVAVARNGNVYWTCTIAGVIVEARRVSGRP